MAFRASPFDRSATKLHVASAFGAGSPPVTRSVRKETESFRGLVIGLGISVAVWSSLGLVVSHLI